MPLRPNTTVSFRRPTTNERIDGVDVRLVSAAKDVFLRPYAADFTYRITWDDAVRFSDGTPPGNGDEVLLASLARQRASLAHVNTPDTTIRKRWMAYIKDGI